jgi:hypothetical protein
MSHIGSDCKVLPDGILLPPESAPELAFSSPVGRSAVAK